MRRKMPIDVGIIGLLDKPLNSTEFRKEVHKLVERTLNKLDKTKDKKKPKH
jgi:queuine/archaeosine tRNA-ribosyltransferase